MICCQGDKNDLLSGGQKRFVVVASDAAFATMLLRFASRLPISTLDRLAQSLPSLAAERQKKTKALGGTFDRASDGTFDGASDGVSDGTFRWSIPTYPDVAKEQSTECPMENSDGTFRWSIPMDHSDETFRWNIPMEHSDGT